MGQLPRSGLWTGYVLLGVADGTAAVPAVLRPSTSRKIDPRQCIRAAYERPFHACVGYAPYMGGLTRQSAAVAKQSSLTLADHPQHAINCSGFKLRGPPDRLKIRSWLQAGCIMAISGGRACCTSHHGSERACRRLTLFFAPSSGSLGARTKSAISRFCATTITTATNRLRLDQVL